MSWFRNKKRPTLPVPQGALRETPAISGEYSELAKELGFRPRAMIDHDLRRFLFEQGVHTYEFVEVSDYLDSVQDSWLWKPLRKADQLVRVSIPGIGKNKNGRYDAASPEWSLFVPKEALDRVKLIEGAVFESGARRFPDVSFMVSYALGGSDFVAVAAVGIHPVVFCCWHAEHLQLPEGV